MTDVMEMADAQQTRLSPHRTHTVRRGESLSHIARHDYGTTNAWQTIFRANRNQLSEPNQIREGMTLRFP